jgi:NAD(P)H-binding
MLMKLFVIGATGRTGLEIVQQALARGHHVTAFVRSPENITLRVMLANLFCSFVARFRTRMDTDCVTRKQMTIIEQDRFPSPAPTPQALTWDSKAKLLWMGSRDLRRIYAIDPEKWTVVEEREAPGIPWAAVATNGTLRFTIGEGPDDDRYIRRFVSSVGFSETDRIACPEFTGSYLSYDGEHVYLSQWYKHRILKLDANGNILRIIEVGAEISGHAFIDGLIYILRGTEQNGESWRIARLDPQEQEPEIEDIAIVPFACRSLTFDGEHFWSNHRAANEIVSFRSPTQSKN